MFYILGKSPNQAQTALFEIHFETVLNPKNFLYILSKKIDWQYLESEFSVYYSKIGRASVPLRMMLGCLLLKELYQTSDENLPELWVENPYMQYFCGENYFQHDFPFDPSDFVHFRKRIGSEGFEKLLAYSAELYGKKKVVEVCLSDTTVQENHITFPTGAKLASQICKKTTKIAQKEGIKQRQSYVRVVKGLVRESHHGNQPKKMGKAKKARKKLETIAYRQIRELRRKLSPEQLKNYEEELCMYEKILCQDRTDGQKCYSLQKVHTACIAKGKQGKKYEYGNKVGILVDAEDKIIWGIEVYEGNPYDGKTIAPLLEQFEK